MTPVLARYGWNFTRVQPAYEPRRAEHDQLGLVPLIADRTEQRADHRQIAKQRRDRLVSSDAIIQETANRERLAILQLNGRRKPARATAGDAEALRDDRVGEVDVADLRAELQTNTPVTEHDREEVQLHTELAEFDRD